MRDPLWARFLPAAQAFARAARDWVGSGIDAPTAESAREVRRNLFALRCGAAAIGLSDFAHTAGRLERLVAATAERRAARRRVEPAAGLPAARLAAEALFQAIDRADTETPRLDDAALERAISALLPLADALEGVTVGAPIRKTEPPPDDSTWNPSVEDDMIEAFLEEAAERLEALAEKLVRLEGEPGNAELVREIFRDLHTLKGGSAFVGLARMNRLAHKAEDLVAKVRDGSRGVDAAVVDVLLGTLDSLRQILDRAARRAPIDVAVEELIVRLEQPSAARPEPPPGVPLRRVEDPPAPSARPTAGPPAPAAIASEAGKQTLRVDFEKLDDLLNLVGELVIGKNALSQAVLGLASLSRLLGVHKRIVRRAGLAGDVSGAERKALLRELVEEIARTERAFDETSRGIERAGGRLDRISGNLRDQVMKLRMVPIARVFTKYHRTVRDLSKQLGKKVRLEIHGGETELDKILVEALDGPLMHLVRNSLDHGIESEHARISAGKPAEGVLTLAAHQRGNQIVVEVSDDGGGIPPDKIKAKALEKGLVSAEELARMDERQVLELIFRAGFSTAAKVTDVSGRGVGMDVVREAISQLKGTVDVASVPGQGSTFTMKLPLTLAIIQVLLVRAGGETLALPIDLVQRTLHVERGAVRRLYDRDVIEVAGKQVPLLSLARALDLETGADAYVTPMVSVILVELFGETFGLVADRLDGKREIVIKTLGDLLENVRGCAGATLDGEKPVLILDVPAVLSLALEAARGGEPTMAAATRLGGPRILVVDDSDMVRDTVARALRSVGYTVVEAADGVDGLAAATSAAGAGRPFDLVTSDVMMPRMDGYELARQLRAHAAYAAVPIVMLTSRGETIDRIRGFDAGVSEYLVKPVDRAELLRAVSRQLEARRGAAEDAEAKAP